MWKRFLAWLRSKFVADDYGYETGSPDDLGADWEKDPDETSDYTFDWGKLDGDTITLCEFFLPDGLTSVSEFTSGISCTIFVSGGSAGSTYRITNRIHTTAGRIWERTGRLKVKDL